jgi:hypothetical protein
MLDAAATTGGAMTDRQVQRIVGRWRRKLGMDEWRIKSSVVSADVLNRTCPGYTVSAHCDPDLGKHRANVRLSADVTKDAAEETIIHELLHILLDPNGRIADDAIFETGLDRAARAFVKLSNGSKNVQG